MSAVLDPTDAARTFGATRSYPNRVTVGDVIISRESAGGGHYTDAGTVARGHHGRHYHVVTGISRDDRYYRFEFADGDELRVIYAAANSKVLVRRQRPVA